MSYVFCGRDPRDAFLSMMDHFANFSAMTTAARAKRAGLDPQFRLPDDPNILFPVWLTVGAYPWMEDGFPFGSCTFLTASDWAFRHLPNILFLHYGDLTADLDVEMRRLSAFLAIPVDDSIRPSLLAAASFTAMKDSADEAAPGAHLGEWRSNADFFRMARMGQWREILTPENQALSRAQLQSECPRRSKRGWRAAAPSPVTRVKSD